MGCIEIRIEELSLLSEEISRMRAYLYEGDLPVFVKADTVPYNELSWLVSGFMKDFRIFDRLVVETQRKVDELVHWNDTRCDLNTEEQKK